MLSLESIKAQVEQAIPGAKLAIVRNDAPSAQHSLLVDNASGLAVATFLRDDPALRFDYASNVTGVDWPEMELTEKIKVKKMVEGVEKEVEEVKKTLRPGYLEAVYHLYSMDLKHGPLILRLRTENRTDKAHCAEPETRSWDCWGQRLRLPDGRRPFPLHSRRSAD